MKISSCDPGDQVILTFEMTFIPSVKDSFVTDVRVSKDPTR